MPRISAERIFRSHFPKARIETHRQQLQGTYYLIRLPGAQMWTGCGDTKAQAWADACDRVNLTALYAGMCPRNLHGLDYAGQPCDLCKKGPKDGV